MSPGPSLYARITGTIIAVLALGALVLAAAAWRYARTAADEAYDRLLAGAAFQIAETIHVEGGIARVDPPVAAFETLGLAQGDRIFYRVYDPAGRILTGYADLTPPGAESMGTAAGSGPIFGDSVFRGTPVRWVLVGRYTTDPQLAGWASVLVAQTRDARTALAAEITGEASLLIAAMSLIAFVSVMLAVRRALAPLAAVGSAIAGRDPHDLTPLAIRTPREVAPLLGSVNYFMARLGERMATMQRFIADSAHQIRTPLAALCAQIELLEHETDPVRRGAQMARLRARTDQLGRLVNQLLGHAMVIHRAEAVALSPVDLVALARHTLANAVPTSDQSEIEIAFDATMPTAWVAGDAISLREAVSNLINNALTHGAQRMLLVRVSAAAGMVTLSVSDDGPGIEAADWARLLEPFQSARPEIPHGSGVGSGLGLAIVADVAKAHGAQLYGTHPAGGGFSVSLRFPALAGGQC